MFEPAMGLYVILDRRSAASAGWDVPSVAREAYRGGARWFQCRFKELADRDNVALSRRVVEALGGGARVVVNGRLELALAAGADGVHLRGGEGGVEDVRQAGLKYVGQSCHDAFEVAAAQSSGVDFVTYSPVFKSVSKPGYGPLVGVEGLRAVCSAHEVPVVALGGLRPYRVRACRAAGARGVAVMSDICGAADPARQTRLYLDELTDG